MNFRLGLLTECEKKKVGEVSDKNITENLEIYDVSIDQLFLKIALEKEEDILDGKNSRNVYQ